MKFYGDGKVLQYDPKTRNTVTVCRFENGSLETNDEGTIKLLKQVGYRSSGAGADPLAKKGKETKNADQS